MQIQISRKHPANVPFRNEPEVNSQGWKNFQEISTLRQQQRSWPRIQSAIKGVLHPHSLKGWCRRKKPFGGMFYGQMKQKWNRLAIMISTILRWKAEAFKPENTIPIMKNWGGSTMLWGCLAGQGLGALQELCGIMRNVYKFWSTTSKRQAESWNLLSTSSSSSTMTLSKPPNCN